MAALRLTLKPGWKTYWRSPGDAGIPPKFDWTGSTNLAGMTFHWPTPQVFDLSGLRTLGYRDELILPFELSAANPQKPIALQAKIDIGVCEDICVPVTVTISGVLSGQGARDPIITAALAAEPKSGSAAGIATPHCRAEPIKDGLRLTTVIALPGATEGDFAVTEIADRSVWIAPVETNITNADLIQVSDLVPSDAKPFALDRSSITTTVFTGAGTAVELQGCQG